MSKEGSFLVWNIREDGQAEHHSEGKEDQSGNMMRMGTVPPLSFICRSIPLGGEEHHEAHQWNPLMPTNETEALLSDGVALTTICTQASRPCTVMEIGLAMEAMMSF